jgi:N-acetylglucosamine-6-phosphate deacetylase
MRLEEKRIVIQGAHLIFPDHIARQDLIIAGGKLAKLKIRRFGRLCAARATILEVKGLYVSPGFIDLQVNGGGGRDFIEAQEEEVKRIASFHASHGTTGLLATLVTAPIDQLRQALESIKRARAEGILGVHLEGPFIAIGQRGAHNPKHILEPSLEQLRALTAGYRDLIRIVTLAPELPGADRLIEEVQEFAIPALGHSNATYEEALAAVNKGVKLFTHLFNAMSGFHHREPGAVGAALEGEAMVSLIVDGIHVHPAAVRLALKAKGIDKICLITDSISAAGLGDGRYSLGGQEVLVEGGVARLSDGTLAGSTLTMERAVKNFMEFTGCSLPEAVRAASLNPARLLGLDGRKGSLEEGKDADLVIFDGDLNVHYTIVGGRIVYARDEAEDRR